MGLNIPGGSGVTLPVAVADGGTGQTTANAGFNALSPMTTGGDIIYGGASGVGTRLANGSDGQFLRSAGTTAAPTWSDLPSAVSFRAHTSTTAATTSTPFIYTTETDDSGGGYNTSTGVYTIPTGCGGLWMFGATMYVGATSTYFDILVNGTSKGQSPNTVSNAAVAVASNLFIVAAGDTVEIRPGANATATTGEKLNNFWGFRIHP